MTAKRPSRLEVLGLPECWYPFNELETQLEQSGKPLTVRGGFHDQLMEQGPTSTANFAALHIASCLRRLAMANSWNIPPWLEMEVRARDKVCVYCSSPFTSSKISKKSAASWEHIINDEKIITRENIALCCCGCNASKGQKQLSVWLQSKYCKERGITKESVAPIIKQAIADDL